MPRISRAGACTTSAPDVIGGAIPQISGFDERAGSGGDDPLEVSHGHGGHWTGSAPHLSVQVLSEPATIAAIASSTFFWISGVIMLARSWPADTPMPWVFASNRIVPLIFSPAASFWMTEPVAIWRCFSALVMVHLAAFGYDRAWSTSTPTP